MWRVLTSLLGVAVALVSPAAAATTPPVHLKVEHCQSLDEASIRRIFTADLGAPATAEVGPEVTEVNISCAGDRVVVRVKDPLSRKTLRRSFDPKSFGNRGQSRLIAIAASELVLASWAELADNPTPVVLGEGEPAKAETVETARSVVKARNAERQRTSAPATLDGSEPPEKSDASEPHTADRRAPADASPAPAEFSETTSASDLPSTDRGSNALPHNPPHPALERAMAIMSVRSFLRGQGSLFGGGARLAGDSYGVVSWAADALVENGKLDSRKVTSATVGGSLAFYLHAEPLTARLGAGLRAGMIASAHAPTVAPWGWPMAVASVSLHGGPVVIDVAGEAGLVDLSGNPEVRGVWVSGQVGFGLVL